MTDISTIFAPIKIHSSTTKATSRYDDVTFVKAGLVCVIMMEFVIVPRIATTVSTDSHVPISSAPLGQGLCGNQISGAPRHRRDVVP